MNKIILIGNVTRDPETGETPSGVMSCRFGLAVKRDYKTGDEYKTDFFNVTTWRAKAEVCAKFIKKGSKIAVMGSMEQRTYEDRDGNQRTIYDVNATEIELLNTRQGSDEAKEESKGSEFHEGIQQRIKGTAPRPTMTYDNEELPF